MNMDMDANPESDEDVSFADIKRQIMLLTMDEDEVPKRKSLTTLKKNPPLIPLQLGSFDHWTQKGNRDSPLWSVNENQDPGPTTKEPNNVCSRGLLPKESKGTGVFIPPFRYRNTKKSRKKNKERIDEKSTNNEGSLQ
ncbi:uncharacterized protein LOC143863220 [Tasmannia lanceolata]|uniref:uncharacterized protein LOC143863220 n=1 Tax=Tasmannia lanceolata TaxID=3420 RepID=UPI0040633952